MSSTSTLTIALPTLYARSWPVEMSRRTTRFEMPSSSAVASTTDYFAHRLLPVLVWLMNDQRGQARCAPLSSQG